MFTTPAKNVAREQPANLGWATLGLSPPSYKVNDNALPSYLTVVDVEERMRADGMANHIRRAGYDYTPKQQILYFLYGSGFARDAAKASRVDRMNAFLEPDPQARMLDMLKQQHKDRDVLNPEMCKVWSYGQQAVLRYANQANVTTIFKEKEIAFKANIQNSDLCYSHAAVGVLDYNFALGQTLSSYVAVSIDIPKFQRHFYRGDKLEERVVHNNVSFSLHTCSWKRGNVCRPPRRIWPCSGKSIQNGSLFHQQGDGSAPGRQQKLYPPV